MKKRTDERTKKIWKQLDRWTRAEIMYRHGAYSTEDLTFIQNKLKSVKAQNRIRKILYGTHDLKEIGKQLGLDIGKNPVYTKSGKTRSSQRGKKKG